MNINYIRSGNYFIPDLELTEESRSIGKWGRMHREYLREYHPIRYNSLLLSGELWTYLADLNQQAQLLSDNLLGSGTDIVHVLHPRHWVAGYTE